MVVVELCVFAYFLHIILSALSLSLSLSLSLYDKKYVEKAFSDTQKLVPCWLTRGIGTKFIFNPSHTYNSIHYYIPIKKKNLLLYFLSDFTSLLQKKSLDFSCFCHQINCFAFEFSFLLNNFNLHEPIFHLKT